MAWCYLNGYGFDDEDDEDDWTDYEYEQSLELARESSGKGSRYGQLTLGELHRYSPPPGGLVPDSAQTIAFYRLAAAQGLDGAQLKLGDMYDVDGGYGVARDFAEALRWYQLAAAQGHPDALYCVARCHQLGVGVAKDVAEAARWYRRAQAAGRGGGV
jgi:TPR repeat protein